jgi:hypothetical protein
MSRIDRVRHEFVEFIPASLDEGIVYVSIPFATAVHRCCCGCGQEVVTPLSPTDWALVFDGLSISLKPSIGSWGLPCQSHYWIVQNRIRWTKRWSRAEIDRGREKDRRRKDDYFKNEERQPSEQPSSYSRYTDHLVDCSRSY